MKNATMKAVICTKYGGPEVLQYTDVEKPSPKENELLIKIKATAVTAASSFMRMGTPYIGRLFLGLTKPKIAIQGTDLAGEVVAIGQSVTKYKVGDQVIAATDIKCGTYAEYICLAEDDIILHQPSSMTAAEATAMLDGAGTAFSFFRDSIQLKKGQKVLINGASGSIGTAAIQLAKYFGAEVTGRCSAKNAALVKSLGADEVLDYNKTAIEDSPQQYDVIFDTVGKLSASKSKKTLAPNGVFLSPVLSMSNLFYMLFGNLFSSKKVKFSATGLRPAKDRHENLCQIKDIIEQGHFKTIIDRQYRLDQIQEAHRYVDQGHKVGNVVIINE